MTSASLRTFLAARLAREGPLGLGLTVGLLVGLSSLWAFAGVTEDVLTGDTITQVDLKVLHVVRSSASPTGDDVMYVVSMLGSPVAMGVLGVLGAVRLGMRRDWALLTGWVATFLGAGLVDMALKALIRRPRPVGADIFVGASFSFPSGHTLGSLCGFGILTYMVLRLRPRLRRWPVIVSAAILVLLIGASRIGLGVHYLSDVAGGYAGGALWLSMCIAVLEIQRSRGPWKARSS